MTASEHESEQLQSAIQLLNSDPAAAEGLLSKILVVQPEHAVAIHFLGLCKFRMGQQSAAESLLLRSVQLAPECAGFLSNLGKLYIDLGRSRDAIAVLERAVQLRPDDIEAVHALSRAHKHEGEIVLAAQLLERALERQPNSVETLVELGHLFRETGQTRTARECYRRAAELDPNHWIAQWNACLTLPIVYSTEAEIVEFRALWNNGVDALNENARRLIAGGRSPVAPHTNFYLHYQGCNDLKEQCKFAALITQLSSAQLPVASPAVRKRPRSKRRVGFISAFFNLHTVFKLFHGWIKHLNRREFDITGIYLGRERDKATSFVAAQCDEFLHIREPFERQVDFIQQADVDVLIYWEVGMDPVTQRVAALRLAPVQCITWGHPVTSGLRTIDYFLSSELMEPPNAEEHYTERLVRLPNLSIWYPPPDPNVAKPPAIERGENTSAVFLCLQSLFKLLPQYDGIFARIARGVPRSEFWFIGLESANLTKMFEDRLYNAFIQSGLDPTRRIRIIPKMPYGEFLGLIRKADIILDSMGWSGGNTTMEAIGIGKPIVTCPGELMRSRHSGAILTRIGVVETIAANVEQYVNLAIRLAADRAWYDLICGKIASQKAIAYRDMSAIAGLERFLQQLS